MNIDIERKAATQRVERFRRRYRQLGDDYFPVQIAVRWQRAVHSDEIDLGALREIFENAKARRNDFDISFFTFCNDMEAKIRDSWGDSLNRSAG